MYWITEAEDDDFLAAGDDYAEESLVDKWIDEFIDMNRFKKNVQDSYDEVVNNYGNYATDFTGETAEYMIAILASCGTYMAKNLIEEYNLLEYLDNPEDIPLDENGDVDVDHEDYFELMEYDIEPFFNLVADRLQEIIDINTEDNYQDWGLIVWNNDNGDYGFILQVSKKEIDGDVDEEQELIRIIDKDLYAKYDIGIDVIRDNNSQHGDVVTIDGNTISGEHGQNDYVGQGFILIQKKGD